MGNSKTVSKAVFFLLLIALSFEQSGSAATLFPNRAQAWTKIPTVVVSGKDGDPRNQLVIDAVDFWNQQLFEIGSAFRLGPVTFTNEIIPDEELERRSNAVLNGQEFEPTSSLMKIHGDIIVALSDWEIVSFARPSLRDGRRLVVIRGYQHYPPDGTKCGPKCDSARAGPRNRAWPQQRSCVPHVWQTRLVPAECVSVWNSKVLPSFGRRKTNTIKTLSSYLEGR